MTLMNQKNHNKIFRKNKVILKSQERFQSERQSILTVKFSKIALSSHDQQRKQTFDWENIFAYGTSNKKMQDNKDSNIQIVEMNIILKNDLFS